MDRGGERRPNNLHLCYLAKGLPEALADSLAGMVDRRIVTTKAADRPHTKGKVLKEEVHYVYRRKGLPCFICGTEVLKREMAGRNLFWCPVCQRDAAKRDDGERITSGVIGW